LAQARGLEREGQPGLGYFFAFAAFAAFSNAALAFAAFLKLSWLRIPAERVR